MKDILQPWLKQTIGCNIFRHHHIEPVQLVKITDEYFSIIDNSQGNTHHMPYHSIVQIISNDQGVTTGGLFEHKQTFALIIKIGHAMEFVPA